MKDLILMMLSKADDYISGEEISQKLNVTRTAVWKNIKKLREEGYTINSATNKGYKLVDSPNLLNMQQIKSELKTNWLGQELIVMQETGSTNQEVKALAANGAQRGLVVATELQSKGKGRLGRTWISPKGKDLCFSILLKPQIDMSEIGIVTLCGALAVCRVIREHLGLDAKIKWPNDVIIGSRKLCGILTEMAADMEQIEYVVSGIGINVNNTDFAEDIAHKATSLCIESGKEIDRAKLLCRVLEAIEKIIDTYYENGETALLAEYRLLCATIGREVSFTRSGKSYVGYASDITSTGSLVVDCSGNKTEISSGEVTVQGIY